MNRHPFPTDDSRLDQLVEGAIGAVRDDQLTEDQVTASTDRVWARLSTELALEGSTAAAADSGRAIRTCDDVQALLPALEAGQLAEDRALLVREHTRECLACRRALRQLQAGEVAAAAPAATAPRTATAPAAANTAGRRSWAPALAAAVLILGLGIAVLFASGFLGSGAVVASVDAIDGQLFLVTDDGPQPLAGGEEVRRGQEVRTAKGSEAVLRLADGSLVEMAERSSLAVRKGFSDTVVDLDQGHVIVEAAKRSRGHLFVDTEDCRVAVTGTIFAVNHGTKGSRVSVLEGAVRVEQGRSESLLSPGDQVTTRAALTSMPLAQEISWSRNADQYRALLAELQLLEQELRRRVPMPDPRTDSALVRLLPASTVLYGAAPNLGESVVEARQVFEERLTESPVLRSLVGEVTDDPEQASELDELIDRLGRYGAVLGDELAVAVLDADGDDAGDGVVAMAQVTDPAGLEALLAEGIGDAEGELTVVTDPADALGMEGELVIWLAGDLVVASPKPDLLLEVEAVRRGAGASLAGSPFYRTLEEAYAEGVEWLLAADLEHLLADVDGWQEGEEDHGERHGLALAGLDNAQAVVARWATPRAEDDLSRGDLLVTFDGPRHGLVSWLSEPAPMGGLEFVSADAAMVSAALMRDPAELLDETFEQLAAIDGEAFARFAEVQAELGVDLRRDLAEPLGGEMVVAVDGPLLPTPSFKVVIEVLDAARFQGTLEMLVEKVNQESDNGARVRLTPLSVAGQGGYQLSYTRENGTMKPVAVYAYVDGYLVMTPSDSLLERALRVRASGSDITTSESFRALMPQDGYANFSALAYQDLSSQLSGVASGIESQLTPEQRESLGALSELGSASLVWVYAESDRIQAAASMDIPWTLPLAALFGVPLESTELGTVLDGPQRAPEPGSRNPRITS